MFINIFQSFKTNSELRMAVENSFNEQSKGKDLRFLLKTML